MEHYNVSSKFNVEYAKVLAVESIYSTHLYPESTLPTHFQSPPSSFSSSYIRMRLIYSTFACAPSTPNNELKVCCKIFHSLL